MVETASSERPMVTQGSTAWKNNVLKLGVLVFLLRQFFSNISISISSHYYSSTKKRLHYYSSTLISNSTNDPKALCPTKCSKILGQNGTWIQDWNYSAMHGQYPSRAVPNKPYGARTYGRFQPSDDAPFPWPTSFRWVDSNSLGEGCQIDYTMNGSTFCDLLLKLEIGMVIFSGDSLTWSMRRSLFNNMGKANVQNIASTTRNETTQTGPQSVLFCDAVYVNFI